MIRRAQPQQPQNTGYTYLEKGTVIHGDLSASGNVRLDGQIKGSVTVRGNLEVSSGASIEGEMIETENLTVHGSIKANVKASGKITITKSGKLIGDVRASALDIESGAAFSGRSEMNPGGSAPVIAAKGIVAAAGSKD